MIFTVVFVMLFGLFCLGCLSCWAFCKARVWWHKDKTIACYLSFFAVICAAIPTAAVICLVDIGGGL